MKTMYIRITSSKRVVNEPHDFVIHLSPDIVIHYKEAVGKQSIKSILYALSHVPSMRLVEQPYHIQIQRQPVNILFTRQYMCNKTVTNILFS